MPDPYADFYEDSDFIMAWKRTCLETDGCSTGQLKKVESWFVKRVYTCSCIQHDFDYREGWRWGMTRLQSDKDLRDGIRAAGIRYYLIAQIVYIGVRIGSGPFWQEPFGELGEHKLLGD